MGIHAGVVQLGFRYRGDQGFWDNARALHRKLRPMFTNKTLFQDLLTWCHLDPTLLEAITFKRIGGLVPEGAARYDKLSAFGAREDVPLSILKRDKADSLRRIVMGTAITNLTRMDFARQYGALELDRLILIPGGAFPLVQTNLVLGAVTCAGRLSLLVEYVEENVDAVTMARIGDKALASLLEGDKP